MNSYNGKRLYMTILTGATVCSVIFGTMHHVGGFFGSAWSWFNLPSLGGRFSNNSNVFSFSETYSGVKNIDIDCARMSLTIVEGTELSVSYDAKEKWVPTITAEDGILSIRQDPSAQDLHAVDLKDDLDLTVTIPAIGMDSVSADVCFGEISLSDFRAKNISIKADMGDVYIDNVSGNDIMIDASMGNIDIEDINCVNLSVNADMGNIEGDSIAADSMFVDANMGNVSLDDVDFKELEAVVDAGNADIIGSRSLSDYEIDLSADMGSVNYRGKSLGNHYTQSGAAGSAIIKVSMGSVSLSY